ncbi:hypothetical protein ACOSP7_009926 [Xanthoceras sorbifolium]
MEVTLVDSQEEPELDRVPWSLNEVPQIVVVEKSSEVVVERPKSRLVKPLVDPSQGPSRPLGFLFTGRPSKLTEDDMTMIRFSYRIDTLTMREINPKCRMCRSNKFP